MPAVLSKNNSFYKLQPLNVNDQPQSKPMLRKFNFHHSYSSVLKEWTKIKHLEASYPQNQKHYQVHVQ